VSIAAFQNRRLFRLTPDGSSRGNLLTPNPEPTMTTKKEPMPDIEISEADRDAVACLIEMATAANAEGMPLKDRHEIWHQAFARHRLAATAAERERIIKGIDAFLDSLSPSERGDLSATYAIARILAMLQPTPEATT
jgi:hypothetical protein